MGLPGAELSTQSSLRKKSKPAMKSNSIWEIEKNITRCRGSANIYTHREMSKKPATYRIKKYIASCSSRKT